MQTIEETRPRITWGKNVKLPFQGLWLPLVVGESHQVSHLERQGDSLCFHPLRQNQTKPQLCLFPGYQVQHPLDLRKPVLTAYRATADLSFHQKISQYMPKMDLIATPTFKVRAQRTRWGSCSTKGTLSFNWRLILAPSLALEYVVIHELCHLREHNHSSKFWQLVANIMPGYQRQRDWLKEHGNKLFTLDKTLSRDGGIK